MLKTFLVKILNRSGAGIAGESDNKGGVPSHVEAHRVRDRRAARGQEVDRTGGRAPRARHHLRRV